MSRQTNLMRPDPNNQAGNNILTLDNPLYELLQMLTWKRPYGSQSDKLFVEYFLTNLCLESKNIEYYFMGPMCNLVATVKRPDGTIPRTMFSCHTDTSHYRGGKQKILFDKELNVAYKDDNDPLGADDTAGVWLMRELLVSGMPGVYIFHRGEEAGCIGSKWISDNEAQWLKDNFDRAIAFDRRGCTSIITHQRGGQRGCSDAFALALARELGPDWRPDDTGIVTDTGQYMGIIPECTNISVGYEGEHTSGEILDCGHLLRLRDTCWTVDFDALPTARDPSKRENKAQFYNYQQGFQTNIYDTDWNSWPKEFGSYSETKIESTKPADLPISNRIRQISVSDYANTEELLLKIGAPVEDNKFEDLSVNELCSLASTLAETPGGIEELVWADPRKASIMMMGLIEAYCITHHITN